MALRQDERALLQLLLERGQSYGDLAELLGIPEAEVRGKARGALRELAGDDPDREVGLTDYLLGQADPIGRADAVRYLQQSPEGLALAERIVTRLEALAPSAELPRLPEQKGRRRRGAAQGPEAPPAASQKAPPSPRRRPRPGPRNTRQARLIAGLVAGGLVLVFAILAIAGVFDSGDDAGASDQTAAADAQPEITPVRLEAEGGSGVGGVAEFGLDADQLFVDLELDGLDPNLGRDRAYVLWMMLNRNAGYPVTLIAPNSSGSVRERYVIPAPVALVVGGSARFVEVSESPARELRRTISAAVDQGAPVVPFSGTSLARGRLPLADEADPLPRDQERGGEAGGG